MKEIKLPMKSFQQFITEARSLRSVRSSVGKRPYDPDVMGRSQIRKTGEGGRIDPNVRKKTDVEIRRVKAVGGGKTEPIKSYKDRKDIGKPNVKRSPAGRQQQPTKERGSAKLDPREAQRKAARERRAAKAGAKTKTADELLAKKAKAKVDPNYKPAKASGMTRAERMSVIRKGEAKLRNIMKDKKIADYKKETGQDPDKKAKQKIMGRVHQQMKT